MLNILDLVFPKRCLGCNSLGSYICDNCFNQTNLMTSQKCPHCHQSSSFGMTHEECKQACPLDGAISIFQYKGLVKKILWVGKYQLVSCALKDLFSNVNKKNVLTINLHVEHGVFLQPIPLHKNRERIRGFNQAKLITHEVEKLTSFKSCDTIKRVKDTKPQALISAREQRKKNISGAFVCSNSTFVKGKTIYLIDDLFTSGSTCKEAALVLKKAGAHCVFAITLAHG